jgi:6-pyruvoyltetrahydropterin/6-carboxytetrahydropterin synthase
VDSLDEHVLIPGQHPVLTARPTADGQMEIRYGERFYSIPAKEVIVLPISNSSAENLATWVGREILARIERHWPGLHVQKLSVGVEETPGQRGIYTVES